MEEIRAIPWNGLKVASTFSGGGGSSLGYRMAGFRVAWASEFVAEARETYAANFPGTLIDPRDIRDVRPEEILSAIGMSEGELDLLDGSPPCASFSTAGRREKKWGKESKYSSTRQRTDDLFFEYARLLRGLRPRAFVAENVAGLVRGVAKGYFVEIHEALRSAGYRVAARLLDAQWLGVPQVRKRVIFVGVRDDLGIEPAHPDPLPYGYSIRDAIPWMVRQMSNAPYGSKGWNRAERAPSQTIGASPRSGNGRSPPSLVEAEADIGRFAIGREFDRIREGGRSGRYFQLERPKADEPMPTVTQRGGGAGVACALHPIEKRKLTIAELKRICSFPDDFVLTGTYEQQWERCGRAVPPLMMMRIAAAVRDGVFGGGLKG